jgi:two-component system OmpR family sensor kinase
MVNSLRARLLVWYAVMLASVVVVFGAMVCYVAWRARLADVDEELRRRAAALAAALQPVAPGTFDLRLPDTLPDPGDVGYHAVWTEAGTLIDQSHPEIELPPPAAPGLRTRDGRRELTLRAESGASVLTGLPLADARADIARLAATMAAVGGVALAACLLAGWWVVGRALRPVHGINRTARAMIEGDFAARIPIERVETDLEQLARALNGAFDRLHASLERQRRFTADASHELRTPLATISTETQWALGRDRGPDDYRRSLEVCQRAARRMQTIVERLLTLARADAAREDERRVPVRLDALAASLAHDLRTLSDARRLDVSVDATPASCLGDPDRLYEALTNVVVNAIQYNVEGGRLRIEVREAGEYAEVIVADTGVGIPAAQLPHVFEPFFRGDAARSHEAGGAGLGLAVTQAIVKRHGGDVRCTCEPGRGTTVVLRLARGDLHACFTPAK